MQAGHKGSPIRLLRPPATFVANHRWTKISGNAVDHKGSWPFIHLEVGQLERNRCRPDQHSYAWTLQSLSEFCSTDRVFAHQNNWFKIPVHTLPSELSEDVHADENERVCTYTCMFMCIYTNIYTCAYAWTCTETCTCKNKSARAHTHTHRMQTASSGRQPLIENIRTSTS